MYGRNGTGTARSKMLANRPIRIWRRYLDRIDDALVRAWVAHVVWWDYHNRRHDLNALLAYEYDRENQLETDDLTSGLRQVGYVGALLVRGIR